MSGLLRVVQLNIGSLLEPGWAERRNEIVSWLDHLAPDIVCFQEVWEDPNTPNTARWLAEHSRCADWSVAFGGDSLAEQLWPDPALLVGSAVLSRWPIDEERHLRLPVADDGDPFPRQAPWELVHARTAGLDIFSVHLAAAPTHSVHRRLQVLAIDDYVRSVRAEADRVVFGVERDVMPAVMCGDFNAEPDSDEIRFLTSLAVLEGRAAFWQDAWRVAGEGPGLTQDWRTNPAAAALNVHPKRIDYIFVGDPFTRRGSGGRVLNAELAFHTSRTGVLASDHAGVVADIVWPDRPPAPAGGR